MLPENLQLLANELAKNRSGFESAIEHAGSDIDAIIALSGEIVASDFHPAIQEVLLKKCARAAGVSIGSLRKGGATSADPAEAWVAELNERHAIVPVGGRVTIMNREYDPALDRDMLTFSGREDFVLRYSNRPINYRGGMTDVGTAWLSHPDRRQYEGVVFAPGREIPGYYNLFQGFAVKPDDAGSCELFEEFLIDVICSGDRVLFGYLWGWLAHLFQKPGELPGTSIVLRGKQGIGKNRFVDTIGHLIGKTHYLPLSSLQQITGRFSGHLADALLVFANEAIWGGDKSAEGALKAMITDGIQPIERKGKDIVATSNFKRLMVASNEDWVVPRGSDDRRHVIIDVSDAHQEDMLYFGAIKRELESGGYEALMHALLSADITAFNPRDIPGEVRQRGWELKIRSGGTVLQWWFDMLDRGWISSAHNAYADDGDDEIWPETIGKQDLHKYYLRWCEQHRIMHPEIDCVMGRRLAEWGIGTRRPRGGDRSRVYVLPDLADARDIFANACRIPPAYWGDCDD